MHALRAGSVKIPAGAPPARHICQILRQPSSVRLLIRPQQRHAPWREHARRRPHTRAIRRYAAHAHKVRHDAARYMTKYESACRQTCYALRARCCAIIQERMLLMAMVSKTAMMTLPLYTPRRRATRAARVRYIARDVVMSARRYAIEDASTKTYVIQRRARRALPRCRRRLLHAPRLRADNTHYKMRLRAPRCQRASAPRRVATP